MNRKAIWAAGLLIVGALGAGAVRLRMAGSALPEVDLQAVGSIILDDSFDMGGAVAGPRGRVLVWSASRPRLVLVAGDRRVQEISPATLRQSVGAALLPGGEMEVFDGPRGVVLSVDGSGRVTRERVITGAAGSELAVRAREGWFFLRHERQLLTHTLRFAGSATAGPPLRTYRSTGPDLLPDVRLTPVGADVVVSQVNSPFALLRLTPRGDSTRIAGLLERTGGQRPRGMQAVNGLWAAIPVIPLDRYYLQAIANLRGDRRLLVLLDPARRRAIRARPVDAPLTFFGASPDDHLVYALRQLGTNEIVAYRWQLRTH